MRQVRKQAKPSKKEVREEGKRQGQKIVQSRDSQMITGQKQVYRSGHSKERTLKKEYAMRTNGSNVKLAYRGL